MRPIFTTEPSQKVLGNGNSVYFWNCCWTRTKNSKISWEFAVKTSPTPPLCFRGRVLVFSPLQKARGIFSRKGAWETGTTECGDVIWKERSEVKFYTSKVKTLSPPPSLSMKGARNLLMIFVTCIASDCYVPVSFLI